MNVKKIDWKEVSDRLNLVCDALGATGPDLAAMSGLSTSGVYKVTKRAEKVRADTLMKLAGALNLHQEWLAHGDENEAPDMKALKEWWASTRINVKKDGPGYKTKKLKYVYPPNQEKELSDLACIQHLSTRYGIAMEDLVNWLMANKKELK